MTTPSLPAFSLRRIWPLFVLLAAELAALWLIQQSASARPTVSWTPFSALVAVLILLCGLMPALLRPSRETLLAGCLATVLAATIVTPFDSTQIPGLFFDTPIFQAAPAYLILRMLNGVSVAPLAFHLAARFPRPQPVGRWALGAAYLFSLGLFAVLLVVTVKWLRILSGSLLVSTAFGLILGAGYLLLRQSRRGDPADPRPAQQARLLFVSIALAGLPALLRPLGLIFRVELLPYPLVLAALAVLPLGVAYAILRTDLFGVDRVVRRGLTYALLSVLVLAGYLGLTVALTALLARQAPELRGLAALAALLLAALLFEPARRRVQGVIDRWLYPDRLNFQHAVSEARQRLESAARREQITYLLTHDLPPRLGAEWAALTLVPDPESPGVQPSPPAWNARLVVAGMPLGRYWLGPRRLGPSYDTDERAQLTTLAGQAALALAYADSIEELRQLNRELEHRVSQRTALALDAQRALAAQEERQRLARELHDSVTQALFSINLSARALRNLVRRDPQAAAEGLAELETAAQQALGEMRALLAQLRSGPAVLIPSHPSDAPEGAPVEPAADLSGATAPMEVDPAVSSPGALDRMAVETGGAVDLAALLVEHCARLRREPGPDGLPPCLDVALDAPDSLSLPPALAHDVFLIAREALHNVIKHSGARQADCSLRFDGASAPGGLLRLEIHDHGRGFDPDLIPSGFGLRGLRERVSALGGRVAISSHPGAGVRLSVEIPAALASPQKSGHSLV